MKENDPVKLLVDMKNSRLGKGTLGTVVKVCEDDKYEIQFRGVGHVVLVHKNNLCLMGHFK